MLTHQRRRVPCEVAAATGAEGRSEHDDNAGGRGRAGVSIATVSTSSRHETGRARHSRRIERPMVD